MLRNRDDRDRAQAHTLEAVTASLLLVAGLVFALQATAVTPLTASTSSQHIENQQAATAEGVLAVAGDRGELRQTLLYWNESGTRHWNTSRGGAYTQGEPPNEAFGADDDSVPVPFLRTLTQTFLERGIAFDVNAYYVDGGQRRVHHVVDLGEPSDNAVVASRPVTLYDDHVVDDWRGDPTGTRLADADGYFTDDTAASGVYAVVELEVVVWRM
ncbi:hypothetical protein ACFO0N_02815 [Halobium salinum]|uniref:Uncharacterized protein n=1 Tax=Halobium salinum TaxID=1364940 RepID=A0ABD5P899_9EURY|nr:hypothetical protein [Halobium salinum]